MSTRTVLESRVALRTGRGAETNFSALVYGAFDDFLRECALRFDFEEMTTEDSIAIVSDAYSADMPTSTLSGFESSVHHLLGGAYLRDGNATTYRFTLKSKEWFLEHFQDRSRTGSPAGRPSVGTRLGSTFQWNCPSNASYTLYLQTSHLPSISLFSDGSASTANPIPSLDIALIYYACSIVFDSIGASSDADRMLARAYSQFEIARDSSKRVPGEVFSAQVKEQEGVHPDPNVMDFDEDALATGDVLTR